MGERARTRLTVVAHALAARLARPAPPGGLRRVLVAHNLLLGDTLTLTPLLAKLRAAHPQAEVTLLAHPAYVPLYRHRPYGVRALPFTPRDSATTRALLEEAPFDLALVPGDNRYSWLAAALRSRRIVALSGGAGFARDWLVDEHRPWGDAPAALGDLFAGLAEGAPPAPYARGDWRAPEAGGFERPGGDYAVLHVGASTPLKQWPAERWRALAAALAGGGLRVAWSAGRGQEGLVAACDPEGRHTSYAGRLDLPQLWQLLAGARVTVAPDTGVSYLARIAWTPCVTLFGPGSAVLGGLGDFWRDTPWRGLGTADFHCRDQDVLFGRKIAWVRRCGRSTAECAEPRCMQVVEVAEVLAAVGQLEADFAR